MKFERASLQRYATLRWIVAAVFVALALRLCYIQLIDTKYKDLATSNIIRRVVEYPSRGVRAPWLPPCRRQCPVLLPSAL